MTKTMTNTQRRVRRLTARSLVGVSEGTFVGLTFRKLDGSLRRLNGRLGVTKHLRGGPSTVNCEKYLTVYDVKHGGYRNVSLSSLTEIRMRGATYSLEEVPA